MSLSSFKKSIENANKILEAVTPATPAVVAELTAEQAAEKPAEVTYSFSAEGVNLGQLEKELLSTAGIRTSVATSGDKLIVKTTNPTATVKVLSQLGISAEVDGTINKDKSD